MPEIFKYLFVPFPADVFALGVVLYEMLHGINKYPNEMPRNVEQQWSVLLNLWESRQMVYKYKEDISSECKDLMTYMLHLNPSKRLNMEQVMEHKWIKPPEPSAAKDKTSKKIKKPKSCKSM